MKFVLVLISVALLVVTANGQIDACKNIYDYSIDTIRLPEKKLIYFAQEKSWPDADKACKKLGMRLLTINSELENRLLAEFFTKRIWGEDREDYDQFTWYIWSSGSDQNNEGFWTWASTNTPVNVTSWDDEEPNGGRDENCLELRFSTPTKFLFNDSICRYRKRYICEIVDDNHF